MIPINKTSIPYVHFTKTLDFGFSQEEISICFCAIDPLCTGIGLSKEESLNDMVRNLDEKYQDDGYPRYPKG